MKASSLIILCIAVAGTLAQTSSDEPKPTEGAVTPTPPADPPKNTSTTATTTSNPATATPTPTVPPPPTAGSWNATYSNGTLCILAHLGAQFTFNYTDATGKNQSHIVNLPANETSSNGKCENVSTESIALTFGGSCSMTMNFQKIKAKFSVNKIDVSFAATCFPDDIKPKETVSGTITGKFFEATTGQSYMCNSDQTLASSIVSVQFLDVQLQAFAQANDFKFGPAQECPQDAETSNIVPIAVGAALAALVLIVLIAYLISRNRGQRGYESV